jgi:hypothetical protein
LQKSLQRNQKSKPPRLIFFVKGSSNFGEVDRQLEGTIFGHRLPRIGSTLPGFCPSTSAMT